MAGSCECGNEPAGSIKCGEFLDWLKTVSLLKKDSASWSKYGNMQNFLELEQVVVHIVTRAWVSVVVKTLRF